MFQDLPKFDRPMADAATIPIDEANDPGGSEVIRVGISGWIYPAWRGVFYPDGLVHRRELEFAARQFPTIEVNGTFYSLKNPGIFRKWRDAVPEGFVFSVKGSRFITHVRRLVGVEEGLANFFGSGVLALGDRLGPFLWQLPPNLPFDMQRVEDFLHLLPKTTGEAGNIIRRRANRATSQSGVRPDRPLRHAMEVRHSSFLTPEFFASLRKHEIAFVMADTAGKWPYAEDVTADFVYVRLHGDRKLYESGYGRPALQRWAQRIRRWEEGGQPRDARLVTRRTLANRNRRDVFVYFDNDIKVKAPGDARTLGELVAPRARKTAGITRRRPNGGDTHNASPRRR